MKKWGNAFLCDKNILYLLQKSRTKRLLLVFLSFIGLLLLLCPCSVNCAVECVHPQNFINSLPPLYISELDITLNVKAPDEVIITERYTFKNNQNATLSSVDLFLNMTYTNLKIINTLNQTQLNHDLLGSSQNIRIYFQSVLEANKSRTIDISYNLVNELPIIPNTHSYYMFSYLTTSHYYTQNIIITSRLPEYCYLHETDDFLPCSPPPIENFLSGTRITLIWEFDDLPEYSLIDIRVFFDEAAKPTPIWIFIVGPIAGVAFGVLISYYFFKRKDQKTTKKIGDMFLSDVQKQFLKLIHTKGGKITQTELCKMTGYTRTRVSRNLISLEQQELIRREKWGKNFQVYLTDMGKKVIE